MAHNILIIGNGFDLYHGFPTRYKDFMFLASEWDTFYREFEDNKARNGKQLECRVPINNCREMTQEFLHEFGRHPYLLNKEHISYLHDHIKSNCWIRYFQAKHHEKLKWIDFETEIQNALYDTEEYSMEAIPKNVGKTGKDGLPERLALIPDIFGTAAQNDYINFANSRILKYNTDKNELQNNKEKLIKFMIDELDRFITCFQYYLEDFVGNIKYSGYSKQIKDLGTVDLLSFNYTNMYENVYPVENIRHYHAVHGDIKKGNIVLGISDESFPNNFDYIRFQKYFQRIQKRTGNDYREWIKTEFEEDCSGISQKNVYIMGHSLGIADFGVLRAFFEEPCFDKVTIFYYKQSAYEDLVINLVKALGKDAVIEKIGTQKVVFEQLEEAIFLNL